MFKSRLGRWALKGVVLLGLASFGIISHAELKAHQVKAAYLYQISKFVFWPEELKSKADAFHLCQLGPDAYQGMLDKMQGKQVFKKPIKVRQVSNLAAAEGCHLLVISSPDKVNAKELAPWLSSHTMLTVVDGSENANKGMVAFVIEKQRVRLHINLGLVEQANLSVAANLLEVASHVYRESP